MHTRPRATAPLSQGFGRMVRLLLWFVTAFLVVQTLIGNGGLTDTLRATRERRALTQAIADLKSENRRLAEASRRLREDPAAIEAGFGQLGKHGSMINGEHGACFRLSGVLTQMPLEADTAVDPGVDDFCLSCRVCRDACPPDAIFETKQWVRGFQKWYVNFDKCLPYFHETYGCGICIAVCPWSRPGIAPGLSAKMLRRRQE